MMKINFINYCDIIVIFYIWVWRKYKSRRCI